MRKNYAIQLTRTLFKAWADVVGSVKTFLRNLTCQNQNVWNFDPLCTDSSLWIGRNCWGGWTANRLLFMFIFQIFTKDMSKLYTVLPDFDAVPVLLKFFKYWRKHLRYYLWHSWDQIILVSALRSRYRSRDFRCQKQSSCASYSLAFAVICGHILKSLVKFDDLTLKISIWNLIETENFHWFFRDRKFIDINTIFYHNWIYFISISHENNKLSIYWKINN